MSNEVPIATFDCRRRSTVALRPVPDLRDEADAPDILTACSVCLRVWNGSDWVEAEHAIRELRSYDRSTPPRFRQALCRPCIVSLRARRGERPLPLAA